MIRQSIHAYKAIKKQETHRLVLPTPSGFKYELKAYYSEQHRAVFSKYQLEELRRMGMTVKIDEENQMVEFE